MIGLNFLRAACIFAAGFLCAVLAGYRNGEQMGAAVADVLDTCDELARMDREACFARVDMMGAALSALGDRCVLSVPPGENLRVARIPRGVMP